MSGKNLVRALRDSGGIEAPATLGPRRLVVLVVMVAAFGAVGFIAATNLGPALHSVGHLAGSKPHAAALVKLD
jgi:hypothetical protein